MKCVLVSLVFVFGLTTPDVLSPRSRMWQDSSRAHAQEKTSVWEKVYSEEQAKRGESVYVASACGRCHSNDLGGNEFGPPLVGTEWLSTWSGMTAADVFTLIKDTMPQDDPGRLSTRQTADLLAYIFKTNGIPAGSQPLEPDPSALASIVIQKSAEAR